MTSSQKLPPEGISKDVLWTLADALAEPTVGATISNPNRLNLNQIIRYHNGDVIDPTTYASVRSSAYNIAKLILWPLNSKVQPEQVRKSGKKSPGTKSFYRAYFYQKWMEAIVRLEEMQPLLGLCDGHYKAEAALQSTLDGLRVQFKIRNVGDTADDDDDNSDNSHIQQGKRPGSPSTVSRSPKCNRVSSVDPQATFSLNSRTY